MGGKQWAAITGSVIGDSHIRKRQPNQDAIRFCELPCDPLAFLIAVSDGHGSEKCPRSDRGSRIAVDTAVKALSEFWGSMKPRIDELENDARASALINIERHIRKFVTKEIVNIWMESIDADLAADPLQTSSGQSNRLLAYGATLTVIFLCEHFLACLQLGDAEVLIVSDESKVRRFSPKSGPKLGEETDSLCMANAEKLFKVSFQSFYDASYRKDNLYLICSDGYEKAFESDLGFEQSAIDFANLVSSVQGRETVEKEMELWLREYSSFSGDDVSVGLLFEKMNLGDLDVTSSLNAIVEDDQQTVSKDSESEKHVVSGHETESIDCNST
jgi:hypothetical protein